MQNVAWFSSTAAQYQPTHNSRYERAMAKVQHSNAKELEILSKD
jgi:hypothetical protein